MKKHQAEVLRAYLTLILGTIGVITAIMYPENWYCAVPFTLLAVVAIMDISIFYGDPANHIW